MSSSPRPPRRTLAAATLGVLVLATLSLSLWYVLWRPAPRNGPVNAGTAEHPVAFSMNVGRVNVRSAGPGEVPGELLDAATEGVRDTVEDLYLAGFLDPQRWDGGAFPDAFARFEDGAAARAREDLNALTLGAAVERVEWVEPSRGRFSLQILADEDNRPVTAVAGVVFSGTAHLRDGGTVTIRNGADLFLRPVDGVWRVFSYTASTDIRPEGERDPSEDAG